MAKKHLLYIHDERFADEPRKSELVNRLLSAHYVSVEDLRDPNYVPPKTKLTATKSDKPVYFDNPHVCKKCGHIKVAGKCINKVCRA